VRGDSVVAESVGTRALRLLLNAALIMTNRSVVYVLLYTVVCILGVTVADWFFCFHLLDIVNRASTLQVRFPSVSSTGSLVDASNRAGWKSVYRVV
jgi:hypothetical protein